MFAKYKKIIVIIVIVVVLFFVYSFFWGGKKDDSLLKGVANIPSGADVIGSEIIQSLNQIETLELDRAIFEDPVYRSLVDRSQPIPQEPLGRDNPFAPLTTNISAGTVVNIPTQSPTPAQPQN